MAMPMGNSGRNSVKSTAKQPKHLHMLILKYGIRWNAAFKDRIFRCNLPECFYYNHAGNLLGKKFRCPMCGEEYIAIRDNLAKKKVPHCDSCTKSRRAKTKLTEEQQVEANLKELFGLE